MTLLYFTKTYRGIDTLGTIVYYTSASSTDSHDTIVDYTRKQKYWLSWHDCILSKYTEALTVMGGRRFYSAINSTGKGKYWRSLDWLWTTDIGRKYASKQALNTKFVQCAEVRLVADVTNDFQPVVNWDKGLLVNFNATKTFF